MKKVIAFTVFIFISIWSVETLNAGIVGDINNDGSIDLTEAIYAVQVASGVYPSLNFSCLLVGKGNWDSGENYNPCDVVEYNGLNYACIQSAAGVNDSPDNPAYWTLLTIEGPQGAAGVQGLKGDKGDTGAAGADGADGAAASAAGNRLRLRY
jgi:hypothetical protein